MPGKLKLLLVVFILLSKNIFAQTNNDAIEFTPIEGIKVFTPDNYNLKGKLWGGELAYHFNMTGNKSDYVRVLNISAIDIVGSYRNLQSITINNDPASKGSLGSAYTLTGRLEIPIIKAGPASLLFTPGFGFAYSTATYFTDKNPLIGSHINLAIQAGVKIFTAITPSTGLQAGMDIFHFSNVAVRVPNNGINSFNISLGIVHSIHQKGPSIREHPFNYEYKNSFEFAVDEGMRGINDIKKELYRSGFYAGYSYRLSHVFSLKGGFDAGYYFTVYNPQNPINTFESHGTSYDRWRTGLSVGADMRLGRFAAMAAYGYYLHYNSYYADKTYWTPGFKYYLLQWIAVQAKAYIHGNDADYLGLGVLFRIHS